MTEILQALYFMLPGYLANMMPVLFKWIPLGSHPIYEKLFGVHKTYRGMVVGILGGMVGIGLQKILSPQLQDIELLSYGTFDNSQIFLYGMAFGGGALAGDLMKSFFKRRVGIAPGRAWFPFDQLDFVVGALLAVSPLFLPPLIHIIIIIIATPILHFLTNVFAYFLKLKKVWW